MNEDQTKIEQGLPLEGSEATEADSPETLEEELSEADEQLDLGVSELQEADRVLDALNGDPDAASEEVASARAEMAAINQEAESAAKEARIQLSQLGREPKVPVIDQSHISMATKGIKNLLDQALFVKTIMEDLKRRDKTFVNLPENFDRIGADINGFNKVVNEFQAMTADANADPHILKQKQELLNIEAKGISSSLDMMTKTLWNLIPVYRAVGLQGHEEFADSLASLAQRINYMKDEFDKSIISLGQDPMGPDQNQEPAETTRASQSPDLERAVLAREEQQMDTNNQARNISAELSAGAGATEDAASAPEPAQVSPTPPSTAIIPTEPPIRADQNTKDINPRPIIKDESAPAPPIAQPNTETVEPEVRDDQPLPQASAKADASEPAEQPAEPSVISHANEEESSEIDEALLKIEQFIADQKIEDQLKTVFGEDKAIIDKAISALRETLKTIVVNEILSADKLTSLVDSIVIKEKPGDEAEKQATFDKDNFASFFKVENGKVNIYMYKKMFEMGSAQQSRVFAHELGHVLLETTNIFKQDKLDLLYTLAEQINSENAEELMSKVDQEVPEFKLIMMTLADPQKYAGMWNSYIRTRLRNLESLSPEERLSEQGVLANEMLTEMTADYLSSDKSPASCAEQKARFSNKSELQKSISGQDLEDAYKPFVESINTNIDKQGEKLERKEGLPDFEHGDYPLMDSTWGSPGMDTNNIPSGGGNEGFLKDFWDWLTLGKNTGR